MNVRWSPQAIDGLGLTFDRRADVDLYLKLEKQGRPDPEPIDPSDPDFFKKTVRMIGGTVHGNT